MEIEMAGKVVNLSKVAEQNLISFMAEIAGSIECDWGRAWVSGSDDDDHASTLDVYFEFGTDKNPPYKELGSFGVIV